VLLCVVLVVIQHFANAAQSANDRPSFKEHFNLHPCCRQTDTSCKSSVPLQRLSTMLLHIGVNANSQSSWSLSAAIEVV
jgi:hypothetical protein